MPIPFCKPDFQEYGLQKNESQSIPLLPSANPASVVDGNRSTLHFTIKLKITICLQFTAVSNNQTQYPRQHLAGSHSRVKYNVSTQWSRFRSSVAQFPLPTGPHSYADSAASRSRLTIHFHGAAYATV